MEGEEILELSLDTFLTVTREDQFPLELAHHLSLEQCQELIPHGPGGWRKVSAILTCLLREARESRYEAGLARNDAYRIKQEADERTEAIRDEAKHLIARGEVSVEEARLAASTKIREIQEEAERKCKILRERHSEHEILLGKLLAMIDSHSKCLKDCERVFDEHDDMIRNIVKYTGEKFEDFENNANRIQENNISLDSKIENKVKNLEEKIIATEDRAENFHYETLKLKNDIQKFLVLFTVLPFIGVFLLYFWISLTMPNRIIQETKPSLDQLQMNLDMLKKGIESKVASLESDTVTELKMSQKAISSMDKNLEQRFEIFIKKFQKDLNVYEIQLENFEQSYKSNVKEISDGLSQKLSEIQLETLDKISEASSKMDEFMFPKLWLNKVNSKDFDFSNLGSSLGLYKEEGRENNKPLFKQVGGPWNLFYTKSSKWVLVSTEDKSRHEEEVYIQLNPKLPELTTDKWKYPSHKVSLVHTVPCCKTIKIKHPTLNGGKIFGLTDNVLGGRGVWQSADEEVIFYHKQTSSWQISKDFATYPGWAISKSTVLCPADASKVAPFTGQNEDLVLECI